MLVYDDNTFVTNNNYPDVDWTANIEGAPKPKFVISDNSEFAKIIIQNYPYIDIIAENGVITGVKILECAEEEVITQDDVNLDFDYRLSCLELGI